MRRINYIGKTGLLCCFLFVCCLIDGKKIGENEICFLNKPVVFDFHSDSVHYALTTHIRTDRVKSNEKWIFTPVIILTGGQDTIRRPLDPVAAEGKLFQNLQRREDILYGKDTIGYGERILPIRKDTIYSIPYQGTIRIPKGAKVKRVYVSLSVLSCCDYKKEPEVSADFAYRDAGLNEPLLPVTLKGNGETSENLKIRKVEGRAFLHFDINKSEINLLNEDNMVQIKDMTAAFRKILTDPYARFDSAYIKGQSSPEGPFEFNNKLAIKRSRSALGFLMKELDALKINYKESQFLVSAIPEAWDELSDKIDQSQLSADEKKIVLDIIRNTPIKAEREYKLRQRRKTFLFLKNEILGNIRRVDYAFYLTFKDLTLEEQIKLLHTRPDIYSPSDFLAVANYTTDIDKKTETLLIARKFYPDDSEILASLLDVYLSSQNMEEAGNLINDLDQQASYMKNPKCMRNFGIFYLRAGQGEILEQELNNISFSKESFSSALLQELNYLQGLISLQKREYGQAYRLLESSRDMNTALSLVGLKEYESAWNIVADYPCETAREYYIKAVIAAYSGHKEDIEGLLTKAIRQDSSLRDTMKTEYAFYPYLKDGMLTSLLQ